MLLRFSLYGFLKNQRYFEPFLVLLLLDHGLSFAEIGLLVGCRELFLNIAEIPSGAIADLYGRRRSMVASMLCYIVSFSVFAGGDRWLHFAAAMALYGIGDAFRTGTHKAMILAWLRASGRESERTEVYGYTRSWSKLGSATSVVIAAGLVLVSGDYRYVFWLALIPYVANLINLATYPAALEERTSTQTAPREVLHHTWQTIRQIASSRHARRVLAESMGAAGAHGAVKDYLQPVLFAAALALPLGDNLADTQRSAVLIGAVYFVLHLLSSAASRSAHRVPKRWGGDEPAARVLWWAALVLYSATTASLFAQSYWGIIIGLLAVSALNDAMRPLLVSRLDTCSHAEAGATVFSLEAQARSAAVIVAAPLVGLAVDLINTGVSRGEQSFWPAGVLGVLIAAGMLLWRPPR